MKFVKSAVLAVAMLFLAQGAVFAQGGARRRTAAAASRIAYAGAAKSAFSDTRAIGVGLIIIGAAMGIGGLAKAAVESMARQPETAGNIQTAMIISAALIEGVTFFALIIVMLFVSPLLTRPAARARRRGLRSAAAGAPGPPRLPEHSGDSRRPNRPRRTPLRLTPPCPGNRSWPSDWRPWP